MRNTLLLLFTGLIALSSLSQGEEYQTLAGYNESITISAGQTVSVVSATSDLVLGVKRPSKSAQQFRFANQLQGGLQAGNVSRPIRRNVFPVPSVSNPILIAGPVKLTLRTSGLLTVYVSEPEARRRASYSSATSGKKLFAQN